MDNEIKGEGNSLNYKYRMHDPRLNRFFAPDPLERKYPHYSPYQFSGNKLIQFVELEGLEEALPDPTGTRIETPDGTGEWHVEGLYPLLNSDSKVVGYVVPEGVGKGVYMWRNNGEWRGYFDENDRPFAHYYEDAEFKRDSPISWAIKSAFTDSGQAAIDFVEDPMGTVQNLTTAIKNIPNIDLGKTWASIKDMEGADWVKVGVILAMGKMASGPRKIKTPKGQIKNAGPLLEGGFGISKYYTYAYQGKSFFVSPHAFKHLEELLGNANKLGSEYKLLIGQIFQKSLHATIDDVIKNVKNIQYDKMYRSGGNEIMFGAPRKAGELPAVKHFQGIYKE